MSVGYSDSNRARRSLSRQPPWATDRASRRGLRLHVTDQQAGEAPFVEAKVTRRYVVYRCPHPRHPRCGGQLPSGSL